MSKCEEIPQPVMESIKKNKVVLSGPLFTPVQHGHASVGKFEFLFKNLDNLLAKKFNLYAFVVPITSPKLPESVSMPYRDLNMTIIRENTEGEYTGLEHMVTPGVVESLKIITKESCERIARYAFKRASRKWGSKVIAVHKANIM
jgi:isocitrate dehydrogenase (NAD+)